MLKIQLECFAVRLIRSPRPLQAGLTSEWKRNYFAGMVKMFSLPVLLVYGSCFICISVEWKIKNLMLTLIEPLTRIHLLGLTLLIKI